MMNRNHGNGTSILKKNGWKIGLWVHFILVTGILYLPLLTLILYSFNASRLALSWGGFSLDWYRKVLQSPDVAQAILNSLAIATFSAIASTFLGTMLALGIERGSKRLKKFGGIVGLLPILVPEIVMAIGLLLFFNRLLRPMFHNLGFQLDSFAAVLLGHIGLSISYVMVVIRSNLQFYNTDTELAALDLGANYFTVIRKILLPQIAPGILAGAIMAVAISLDDFYISYFVTVGGSGFKTVPLHIWNLQGRSALTPEINAISVLMLISSAVLMGLGAILRPQTKINA